MVIEQLLLGLALPALTAAVINLAAYKLSALGRKDAVAWVAAAALGVGFLAGHAALFGPPVLIPKESWEWMPHVAAGLTIAAMLVGSTRVPRLISWSIAVVVVLGAGWVLVPPWQEFRPAWIAVVSCAMAAAGVGNAKLAPHRPVFSSSLTIALAAAAAGIVFERAGTARFAQLAGVLAASAGGCMVVARMTPSAQAAAGLAGAGVALLAALMFAGYFVHISEVPAVAFFLIAATPLTAWIGRLRLIQRLNPWPRLGIETASVLAMAGTSVMVAVTAG